MYKNFPNEELECGCCGAQGMDPKFMWWVVVLRKIYGGSMNLSSAYRCVNHPEEIGSPGAHTLGLAIDISISRMKAFLLLAVIFALRTVGAPFHGIGIKQNGEARFIHLDGLPTDNKLGKLRPTIWSY